VSFSGNPGANSISDTRLPDLRNLSPSLLIYCELVQRSWLLIATDSTLFAILSPPGTEFSYGTANDWLALVVADVSGLPFEEYLQKNIFE